MICIISLEKHLKVFPLYKKTTNKIFDVIRPILNAQIKGAIILIIVYYFHLAKALYYWTPTIRSLFHLRKSDIVGLFGNSIA